MSEKLIIENLTKKFGKNEGVENINLSVKEHEFGYKRRRNSFSFRTIRLWKDNHFTSDRRI